MSRLCSGVSSRSRLALTDSVHSKNDIALTDTQYEGYFHVLRTLGMLSVF